MPSIALKCLAQKTLVEQTTDDVFIRLNKEIKSQHIILVFCTEWVVLMRPADLKVTMCISLFGASRVFFYLNAIAGAIKAFRNNGFLLRSLYRGPYLQSMQVFGSGLNTHVFSLFSSGTRGNEFQPPWVLLPPLVQTPQCSPTPFWPPTVPLFFHVTPLTCAL